MALELANLKEGSEEARQKRSIRRYLNKKKDKKEPVEESVGGGGGTATIDEGSEETREARAKRFAQKNKDKSKKREPVEEGAIVIGSMNHMMHAIHNHHQGVETPEYHIHKVGLGGSEHGASVHHYLLVHKRPINLQSGDYYSPAHRFNIQHDGKGYNVNHAGEV